MGFLIDVGWLCVHWPCDSIIVSALVFCQYMRIRAHCKFMLDFVCHYMKSTDGLMRDGYCISEEFTSSFVFETFCLFIIIR